MPFDEFNGESTACLVKDSCPEPSAGPAGGRHPDRPLQGRCEGGGPLVSQWGEQQGKSQVTGEADLGEDRKWL